MGRFYTRHGDKLFIYVTKNDPMLDVDLFPPALDLFSHEGVSMVRAKIAIGKVKDDDSFEKAATVLRLNGFRENQLPSGVLYHYFAVGEESVIEGGSLFLSESESGKSIEVIIPSSVIAGSGEMYSRIGIPPERGIGGIKEGPSIERVDSEKGQASEEDVLRNLKQCMESKGFLFNYRNSSREVAPSLGRSVHMDEGRQNEDAILERLTELMGLLKKLILTRGDSDRASNLVSKSRLESDGWETDRGFVLYERMNPESRGINTRPSLEFIESIMGGLRNAEPDLK